MPNYFDFKSINPKKVAQVINEINDALEDKEIGKKGKEETELWKEKLCGESGKIRATGSYYMQNSLVKPGNNLKVSVKDQCITQIS